MKMKTFISRDEMEQELKHWGMPADMLADVRAGKSSITRDGVDVWVRPGSELTQKAGRQVAEAEPKGSRRDRLALEIREDLARDHGPFEPPKPFAAAPSEPTPTRKAPSAHETNSELRIRLQREANARRESIQGKRPASKLASFLGGNDPKDAA